MAFVFVIVGILMIVTGVKGTYQQFGAQVVSDFTGSQPFTYWVLAIIAVGALGYIEKLRTVSRLFLALILISMVLANKGFFSKLTAALKQGPVAPQSNASSASGSSVAGSIAQAFTSTPAPSASNGQSGFSIVPSWLFGGSTSTATATQ